MDFQRYLIMSIFGLVGPTGLLLNTVIIWTLVRSSLYKTRNYLVYTNLAVCDSINASLVCALGLAIYITGEFIFCKCILIVTVLAYTTSVAIIAFMSFDRYLVLRMPLRYSRIMTRRFMIIVLSFVWSVSVLNGGLLLSREALLPEHDYISFLNRKNCVLSRIVVREYLITWCVLLILVPMVTIVAVNIAIMRLASHHYKQMNRTLSTTQQQSGATSNREWNVKAAFTTVRIVSTNVFCTLPFVCVIFVEAVCEYCVPYKKMKPFYALFLLNFCSTVVNPLVYLLTNKEMKRQVHKLFREKCPCLLRCVRNEEDEERWRTTLSVVVRNEVADINII